MLVDIIKPKPAFFAKIPFKPAYSLAHICTVMLRHVSQRCPIGIVKQTDEGKQRDDGGKFVQDEEGGDVGKGRVAEAGRVSLEGFREAGEDRGCAGLSG